MIRSLSKAHIDNIRSSTSKTLLDEYNNTFSSKKTPLTDKRRTISNITLDIIKQRVENINRNASFNQPTNDLKEDSFQSLKSTPLPAHVENDEKNPTTATTTPVLNANETNGQVKPLKRKLFAPPSLFPEMDSPLSIATPHKTDKKTVNQKRKRNDVPAGEKQLSKSDEKKAPAIKLKPSRKTINPRRSTLFFEEAPIKKINQNANPNPNTTTASTTSTSSTLTTSTLTAPISAAPGLAFTSMHKPQKDFITEVRHG